MSVAANMSLAMFAISVYTAILFTDRLNIHKNLPLVPWVVLQTLLNAAGNLIKNMAQTTI